MASITISAEKVIAACNATLEYIASVRTMNDEARIQRHIGPVKFLGITVFTRNREQAMKYLNNESGFLFNYPSQYAWGDKQHALKLLTLARNGDPVTLNEEDCRVLFKQVSTP